MGNILIASFDMEIGGVERSLLSMLENFDYKNNNVDLMLYSHTGDFMKLLPERINLLFESPAYKTFRMSIWQLFKNRQISLGIARLKAKYQANKTEVAEVGYKQMQYMWNFSLPYLPDHEKTYDVAISYLWPHYFVAEKVKAKTKIAWIHTDFSAVETDIELDIQMWNKFDYIVAVSIDCRRAFIKKYPCLANKVIVIENISSPDFIKTLAKEKLDHPLTIDDRFKIITVARLSYAKGIDQAIKALKVLKNKGYEIAWYVVGYGGDEQMLRELIKECNLEKDFILLGKKENPYPFMKAADLYVQPSRYEGKAVTVKEAQIIGKPVLITNYSTAKSQVQDGIDGVICDLSIEGIVQGVEKLYDNDVLRKKLSATCENKNYNNIDELGKLYELL